MIKATEIVFENVRLMTRFNGHQYRKSCKVFFIVFFLSELITPYLILYYICIKLLKNC